MKWSENVTSFGIKRDCNWLDFDNVSHKQGSKNLVRSILGDPGAVSRVERKGRTKVFKYGRKNPWVLTPTELFPKIEADAASWLSAKNALYYCAQSANSFSWVLFMGSYTTAIVSPHFAGSFTNLCVQGKLLFSTLLTRNEGTTDESKKRLGCHQQEQFNLPREYFYGSRCIVNNRKFKMRWRRESQISNTFTWQNNNFARASRFFVHFFAVKCTTTRENA